MRRQDAADDAWVAASNVIGRHLINQPQYAAAAAWQRSATSAGQGIAVKRIGYRDARRPRNV